jgi:hypothetical protein
MNSDFQTLVEFLGRCGPEVSGHQLPTLRTEEAARLARFARGECAPAERAEICRLLQMHPAWLRWVADRVKLARQVTRQDQSSA